MRTDKLQDEFYTNSKTLAGIGNIIPVDGSRTITPASLSALGYPASKVKSIYVVSDTVFTELESEGVDVMSKVLALVTSDTVTAGTWLSLPEGFDKIVTASGAYNIIL